MSQISDGIGVAAILKNNQYIRFESGLDNEYQVELSRYTTLFKNATDIDTVIEGIKYGFVGRGKKDPQEFWKYFKGLGDTEGFKSFSNDLKKIGINQISQIILWSDEDQGTWRAYRWINYTMSTDQVTVGSAGSQIKGYHAEVSAWSCIRDAFPDIKSEWEDKPQKKPANKFNATFWKKFKSSVNNLDPKEMREDGFYVYDNIIYNYSYQDNLNFFQHGQDDFTIPAGIIGVKGITKYGDILFNFPGDVFENFTITTDLQYLDAGDFFFNGINNLKVIDSKTGELLFQTKAFKEASTLLYEREKFKQFCELLPTSDWEKIQALFKKTPSASAKTQKHVIEISDANRVEIPFPHDDHRDMLRQDGAEEFVIENDSVFGATLRMYTGTASHVTIPKEVVHISEKAFSGSSTLKKIEFSSPVSMGEGALENCINLEEIIVNAKISTGSKNIFRGCNAVKKVTITDNGGLDYAILLSFYEDLPNTAFNYYNGGYYIGSETNPYRVLLKYDDKQFAEATIPSGVEIIYLLAFRGCELLQKVVISEGPTVIADSTFRGCKALKEVLLPSSISNIEPRAFCECTSLEEITIPQGVKKIAKEAFSTCKKLSIVTVSNGTEYIGDLAFANCENLKHVMIPESVKTIRGNAFENSPNVVIVSNSKYAESYAKKNNIAFQSLNNFKIEPSHEVKVSQSKIEECKKAHDNLRKKLYSTLSLHDYSYPESTDFRVDGVYTVDPDIDVFKELCDYAAKEGGTHYDGNWSGADLFSFLKDKTVKYAIGNRYNISLDFGGLPPALAVLSYLSVYSNISSVRASFTRDKWEARGDYSTKNRVGIKFLNGTFVVDKFTANDTYDCESQDYIPSNYTVEDIPNSPYKRLIAYEQSSQNRDALVLPRAIYELQRDVFKGCEFKNIFFDIHIYNIEAGVFSDCKCLERIDWPKTLFIGENMFKNCINLTSVNIPEEVYGIEKGAFAGCINLEKINIPSTVSFIEEGAFDGCDALASKNPEVWNVICSAEKSKEKFLERIESYKQYIWNNGYSTFEDKYYGFKYIIDTMQSCKLWHTLYDSYIDNLDKMNAGNYKYVIWANKDKLEALEVKYDAKLADLGWKKTKDISSATDYLVVDAKDIPRFTTFIAKQKKLQEGDEKGAVAYGTTPLEKAIKLKETGGKIVIITLDNLCELLEYNGVKANHTVPVPSASTVEKEKAKEPATNQSKVQKTVSNTTANDGEDFVIYRGILKQYNGKDSEVVIPETVTKIGERAFKDNKKLKEVTLHDGIVRIDGGAFMGCTSLQSIVIPDAVAKIDWGTFNGCTALKEVTIGKGVTNIGSNAFYNCKSLKSLFIPNSVTYMDVLIFQGCNSLTLSGYANSKAEKYAIANGIKFKRIVVEDNPEAQAKVAVSNAEIDREEELRKIREDNERRVREDQERAARIEAERKALEDEERKKREAEEAVRKAREAEQGKALEEAYRKAQEDAARRAALVAERQAREEEERKKREEIERICREAEERRLRAEAERKAQEEAERKAREEERKARAEAERKAREEEERKAKEEAERKAREEEKRKAAREEAKRKAREEEERKAREEAERKAREEAERLEQERIRAERRAKKLCQHCGGSFKGLFTKKCRNCGIKKDY